MCNIWQCNSFSVTVDQNFARTAGFKKLGLNHGILHCGLFLQYWKHDVTCKINTGNLQNDCDVNFFVFSSIWLVSTSKIIRQINTIRYRNRLIKLDESRLTKFVFNWDYSVNNKNWYSDIENILKSVNLLNLFNEKLICNIQIVQNAIYDSYKNIWIENCRNKPKLHTYIMFKNVFKTEPYVTITKVFNGTTTLWDPTIKD